MPTQYRRYDAVRAVRKSAPVFAKKSLTQRLKAWTKRSAGRVVFGAGLHHRLMAGTATVVTFHRVNDTTVGDGLTCSVDMFKQYARFFADYFHVVSLRDLVIKMEEGRPLERELAITFDDGYRDTFDHAAPVLKAVGLPATFFLVSQFIDTDVVARWDQDLYVRLPWMTWDQVRSLCVEGFDIGAHTRTHPNMADVSTDAAREEILGSRLDLEQRLARPVELFAYPYGRETKITEEHRTLVKAAGFRCCCFCSGGINVTGTDPFHLRRVPIGSWYDSPQYLGCDLAWHRA